MPERLSELRDALQMVSLVLTNCGTVTVDGKPCWYMPRDVAVSLQGQVVKALRKAGEPRSPVAEMEELRNSNADLRDEVERLSDELTAERRSREPYYQP